MSPEDARRAGLDLLARRDLTLAEAQAALVRKGASAEIAREAAQTLERWGLIRDERVAEREAEKAKARRQGRLRAALNLTKRGLGEDAVRDALADWTEEADADRAREALALRPAKSPAQAARRLASQGFEEEAIRSALDEAFPGWDSEQ